MYIIIQTIHAAKSQNSNKNKKKPQSYAPGLPCNLRVMNYFNNSLISIDFS